jgi:hypothetical protein
MKAETMIVFLCLVAVLPFAIIADESEPSAVQAVTTELRNHGIFKPEEYRPFVSGGNVTEPVAVERPDLDFSKLEGFKIHGALVFELFIGADGAVDAVFISHGKGTAIAAHCAGAFFGWRFNPATLNGEPVKVRYITTVRF